MRGRGGVKGGSDHPPTHTRTLTPAPLPSLQTRTRADEACDPMERSCQTPMHTWEARCAACGGAGATRSRAALRAGRGRGRGRGTPAAAYHTCVTCEGVGWVRHTSARVIPDLAADGVATLGRPPRGPDESYDELYWSDDESDFESDDGEGG